MKKILLILCLLLSTLTYAKRKAPKPLSPVQKGTTVFSAPHRHMGCVEAREASSNKLIWRKKVYSIKYIKGLEKDIQWIYIKKLELKGGSLTITNEQNNVFTLSTSIEKESPKEVKLPTKYKIKETDSLSTIADGFYSDSRKWIDIFKENKSIIKDPNKIKTGLIITIPKLKK